MGQRLAVVERRTRERGKHINFLRRSTFEKEEPRREDIRSSVCSLEKRARSTHTPPKLKF
jgi:hypothetical protein